VSPKDLKELLPHLRRARVAHLKLEGLELSFHASPRKKKKIANRDSRTAVSAAPPAPGPIGNPTYPIPGTLPQESSFPTEKVADVVLPQGLEEEIPNDKVLMWSVPGEDLGKTPLTDDEPIVDEGTLAEGRPNG